jgi:hypothetical protein
VTDDERQDLKDQIMQTQFELYKAQLRWEPWKALAAMVAAAAVFMGGVLAVSNWLHPAAQPAFPPGTVITIPAVTQPGPAKGAP